jgi:hypothetical protein
MNGKTNKPRTEKEPRPMTDWNSFPKALKVELWGTEELDTHDPNPLWRSKFTGEVIQHMRDVDGNSAWTEYVIDPAFSTEKFIEERWAGIPKTSTRHCRTASQR